MIEKYVCINNNMYNYLIIGKIYDIKKIIISNTETYILYQDHYLPINLSKEILNKLLIPLSEWRCQKIAKILDDENLN